LWLKIFDRTLAEVVFSPFLAYGKDAFHALDRDEMKAPLGELASDYRNALGAGLAGNASK
jgi:hypothetical protein